MINWIIISLAVTGVVQLPEVPRKDAAAKVADTYQPRSPGFRTLEPARQVCELDSKGNVVRCRELEQ